MSDRWKSAVLLFILVLAATAFALLCKYLGLIRTANELGLRQLHD